MFGVHLLQTVDVLEDSTQLFGVELFVARLQTEPREHGDMADFVFRERHGV